MYPLPLEINNLALPKEKFYYRILLVFSILFWLSVLGVLIFQPLSLVGSLACAGVIYLLVWMTHGLLIARLKSESVHVKEDQLPELFKTHREVCEKLQLKRIPELYVLQSHGVLNAFATRFSGRNFVVIHSANYDAFGPTSGQMRFLIGHEIGHLQRRHIWKHTLVAAGSALPIVGAAYRRACEATCDRFGAFAAADGDGSLRAMMTLCGGKGAASEMDASVLALQYARRRGFFVSWHELNSRYPTFSQRVAYLVAVKENSVPARPGRHPLAIFLALFSSSPALTGLALYVALIGIGAGLMLPSIRSAQSAALRMKHAQAHPHTGGLSADPTAPPSEPTTPTPAPEPPPAEPAAPIPEPSVPAPAPQPTSPLPPTEPPVSPSSPETPDPTPQPQAPAP